MKTNPSPNNNGGNATSPLRSTLNGRKAFPGGKTARIALFATAAGLLATAAGQAAGNWLNTDETWPPDSATQNWSDTGNWDALPISSSFVYLGTGKGTSYLDTNFSIARLYVGNGTASAGTRGVWVGSGGSLAVSANFELSNAGGSQLFTVDTGGSVTGGAIKVGSAYTAGTEAVFTSSGTLTSSAFNIALGGLVQIKGGTATLGNISLGSTASTHAEEGRFIQTGGNTTANGTVQMNGGGLLEISDGSFVQSGGSGLYFAYANATPGTLGGTIHVKGSKATQVEFSTIRYYNADDRAKATWHFTLDNGANHLTKVNIVGQGQTAGMVRAGTLDTDLEAGVLLSGTNAATIIEGGKISSSYNFVNAADFEGGTAKLWTQSISHDDITTRDSVVLTLTGAADKGTLDAAVPNDALSFAAASYGYIDLANIDLENPLKLSLDITGGTLSKFTDALTTAGIGWEVGEGDYELALTLNPEISGGNYFAWDFSNVDSEMALQGIMIPEPSTWALLAGGLGLLALVRRRRFSLRAA